MSSKFKLPIIYKYFLSYFIVFIIPLMAMTSILYKTSVVDLTREIERSNLLKITQLRDTLDLRMKELDMLAYRIQSDPKLTPYMMNHSEITMIDGMNELNLYKSLNAFAQDIFIYFKDFDSVFSVDGKLTLKTFASIKSGIEYNNQDKYEQLVNETKLPIIVPPSALSGIESTVSYLHPIYISAGEAKAVVIYHINYRVLKKITDNMLGELPGIINIYREDGEIITSSASNGMAVNNSYMKYLDNSAYEGVNNIIEDGQKISIITAVSENTGWKFFAAINTSQMYKEATYMKIAILQIALAILTFGIFIIIALASSNYKPIKRMLMTMSIIDCENDCKGYMNEFDKISRTFSTTLEQNHSLKAQIEVQRPLIQQQVLNKIIKGQVHNEAEINTFSLFTSTQIKRSDFFVVALYLINKQQEDILSQTEEYAAAFIYKYGMAAYPVDIGENSTIVIIIENAKEIEFGKEMLNNFANEMLEFFKVTLSTEVVIAIGNNYKGISEIHKSYIDAMAALETYSIKRGSRIIFFDEIFEQKTHLNWYNVGDQLRFIQSIKQGDYKVAVETLENIITSIGNNGGSILFTKYMYFDLVNTIAKVIRDLSITGIEKEVETAMQFSRVDELEKCLKTITKKVCNIVLEEKSNSGDKLKDSMISYIDENYCDNNLSLESCSDKFGIPYHDMSKLFKEYSGMTFSSYVTKLRLNKAMELLIYSEKTIKDIAMEVGYVELTSFIRMFKKELQITPGQYRDMNKAPK